MIRKPIRQWTPRQKRGVVVGLILLAALINLLKKLIDLYPWVLSGILLTPVAVVILLFPFLRRPRRRHR